MTRHLFVTATMASVAVLLAGSARAQAPILVDKTPKLTSLPVTVGGRAVVRAASAAAGFGTKTYVYQWPGTRFDAAFNGTEVYFRLGTQNKDVLHVKLDGGPAQVMTLPKAGTYRVGGLKPGPHRIRVELVTENQADASVFGGFAVSAGESALPVVPAKRQIEIIGDSHTVGYGIASPKRDCSREEVLYATDVERTAGVMIADHYGAEYSVVAISGRGVMRNDGGGPGIPMAMAYPYALENKTAPYPRSAAWQPQVVLLSLGTNDVGIAVKPGERWKSQDALNKAFEAAYVNFLKTLRARYPDAYFVLWAVDAHNDRIPDEVQKVVAMVKAGGDSRIQFNLVKDISFTACDWHPSLADNKLIYNKLLGAIDAMPKVWQGR